MSSLPLRENKSAPLEVVPSRFCPRRLRPGQVKRYMSKGPLFGYMIACPGCHFIELHQHEAAKFVEFVETEEALSHTEGAIACMNCKARVLVTKSGEVVADYIGLSVET